MEALEYRERPVGVFDSGVGGLTVVREIMRQIPNEKIVYFGDTARVPYGSKSRETVTRFSEQIVPNGGKNFHFILFQATKTDILADAAAVAAPAF